MKPTHKNIINKWLKLYFYNYNTSYFSKQKYNDNFAKNIFLYFKSSNEFIKMKLVQKHGRTIKYIIKNGITPSEKVQLAAVQKNGHVIQYIIKNGITPSERVQIASVDNYAYNINYIKNPYPSVIELYEKLSGELYGI
jgi:hypothetical protein